MGKKIFITMFLILGIVFASITIYFSMQPTTNPTLKYGNIPINGNMRMGAIATGIISAACFISASNLIKRHN